MSSSPSPLRLAVIGAGAMGSLHARVAAADPATDLLIVVDTDRDRAGRLAAVTGATGSDSVEAVLGCDAAIVATPAETHRDVAIPLLDAGIPLLIEKPLTPGVGDTAGLIEIARRRSVPITCGFVERFNPVVAAARAQLQDLGPVRHLLSVRHSPPNPRVQLSVVHDLLVHDIDLAFALSGSMGALSIAATAWRHPATGLVDVADCLMTLEGGAVVSLSASRHGQRKVREMQVITDDVLIELDLLRRTMTHYRHVSHASPSDGGYRAETVIDIPFVRQEGEPLALQLRHFAALIRGDADPEAERNTLLAPHQAAAVVERVAVSARTPAGPPQPLGPDRRAEARDAPVATAPVL